MHANRDTHLFFKYAADATLYTFLEVIICSVKRLNGLVTFMA